MGFPGLKKKPLETAAFQKLDAGSAQPDLVSRSSALLQRTIDRTEHAVQVAAKTIDRNNDRNRNARGDQTVFNRRGTTFVSKEFCNDPLHVFPSSCLGE
jgi:hypothetical protein